MMFLNTKYCTRSSLWTLMRVWKMRDLFYCSCVMSVTVPRLTRFPSESATDTTALTTADLSLFLKLGTEATGPGSILALATPWVAVRVMLRE